MLFVVLLAPWPDLVSMRIRIGLSPACARLQRRRVLERMRRHDAVVVVGGRDQRGRIFLPALMLWIGEYASST